MDEKVSDMKMRLLSATVACTLVLSLLLVASGRTGAHTGDWIDSAFTVSPPTIDGAITAGEWSDATAIDLSLIPGNQVLAYLIVKNDANFIYIAYDAIGDTTNDPSDVASIAFDTKHDLALSVGAEDAFAWGAGAPNGQGHYTYDGSAWSEDCSPFDPMLPNHAGLTGSYGFGPSDLSPGNHQIYEIQIPLTLAVPGPMGVIGFLGGSWMAPGILDTNAGFAYSTWPIYLTGPPPLIGYGDLRLGAPSQPDDLDINPPSQESKGPPGSSIDYTLSVVNLGTSVDTFDMGTMATWPTSLWDSTGLNPLIDTDGDTIPDTGALPPGVGVDIVARVQIGASGCDDALIGGVSSNNVNIVDVAMLHTCLPDAVLNPPHSDAGVDTDMPPDGLFDELRIDVGVLVNTAGNYQVNIDLFDQTQSTWITSSGNSAFLPVGPASVTVTLQGMSIYMSGIDGPYYAGISLYNGMGNFLESGSHLTAAYLYTEFDPPGAMLNPPHFDAGVDTDVPPNGLFDELRIDASVLVNTPGDYQASVELYDQAMTVFITSASTFVSLPVGPILVPVRLQGTPIYNSGIDGPYMAWVYLYDQFGNFIDADSFLTQAYLFTEFDPPGAALNPPHSDVGVDTDVPPNGLFNELRIDVEVSVTEAADYQVSVELYDQMRTVWITWQPSPVTFLPLGPNTISVTLQGLPIYASGIDGPYYARLLLYDGIGNFIEEGSHLTQPYLYTDFDSGGATLNPPHSDVGVDTDVPPNGLFDELRIDVGVLVNTAANYDVRIDLYDQTQTVWITVGFSGFIFLPVGPTTVSVTLQGLDIYNSGIDGPYYASIVLRDDMGNMVDWGSHLTMPYLFTDFDPPIVAMLNPPHSDWGYDTDIPPNGLYDALMFDVGVLVTTPGTYNIVIDLWDQTMTTWITVGATFVFLPAGPNLATLGVPGLDIYNSGIDGPYDAEIQLYDDMGTLLDQGSHLTAPYLYTEFDGADALLNPPHTDNGIDTDVPPNGLFDELRIGVGVVVNTAGFYDVVIDLWDQTVSTWITWSDTYTFIPAGPNGVSVSLRGLDIYNSGIDGPYYADITLYDDMGNLLDRGSHITASYLFTDFDGPGALFNPPHSDFGNDTDSPPDGYFDYLQIDVGVTVSQAGTYDVSGPLFDPMMNYITYASTSVYLGIGGHVVPLQYVGRDILGSGYDGPYTALLRLSDFTGTLDTDTYTTGTYTHTQFQPPPARFEPPHSDYGLDLTMPADGLFEFLVVNASVNASKAGTYQVDVTLWDSSYSMQITTASQAADLVVGVQDVPIKLDGLVIRSSGFNGPYWAELTLSDTVGTLDFDTYQTNPYLWNDFSPPGAFFERPYTDMAVDTDTPPSGGFDLLIVDVGVNVTVPGTYLVTGILYYGGWLFIDTATCQLPMNTGRTICPLEFDAHLIADLGLSGTFDVAMSLLDEYGRVMDIDMYTTGSYVSSDFEQTDTGIPVATSGAVTYWKNTAPLNVQFTTTDPVPTDGLETVTLYYRFSTDNSTWNAWAPYASQRVSGSSAAGSIPFSFPSGAGYYEFQMIARDVHGNVEAQGPAESRVAFRPLTEIAVTPSPLSITAGNQGTITLSTLSSGGVAANLEAALTINLMPFSPAGEFRQVGTQTAITSVVIPAGQSSVTVDYYDETSGDWDILGYTATGLGGLGEVTVSAAAATVITITPASGWIQVGGSVNLTAQVMDAFGNSVNPASVAWTVSGPGTLNAPSGATSRLTASSSGAVVVTATIGSLSITATFTGIQPGGGGTGGGTAGADTTTLAAVGIGAIIGGIVIGMLVGLMIGRKRAKAETPVGTMPPPPPSTMPPQAPPEAQPPAEQPPTR